jgi:hypothetical protein
MILTSETHRIAYAFAIKNGRAYVVSAPHAESDVRRVVAHTAPLTPRFCDACGAHVAFTAQVTAGTLYHCTRCHTAYLDSGWRTSRPL